MFADVRTGRKLALGFLSALLPMIVMSGLPLTNVSTPRDNDAAVGHTYAVLDGVETIVSTLEDGETGRRGYLVTGQDGYLEPYGAALQTMGQGIDAVAEQGDATGPCREPDLRNGELWTAWRTASRSEISRRAAAARSSVPRRPDRSGWRYPDDRVGSTDCPVNRPSERSGGPQQRAARCGPHRP